METRSAVWREVVRVGGLDLYLWVMSTAELRKRVIERVRASKDLKVLREVDRLLKNAGQEVESYLTTSEQRKAITSSRVALKKGRARNAGEVDKAVRGWLGE